MPSSEIRGTEALLRAGQKNQGRVVETLYNPSGRGMGSTLDVDFGRENDGDARQERAGTLRTEF